MLLAYVSGHGFGHAVRTAVVLRCLRAGLPRLPIEVVSDAPRWLFPPDVDYHAFVTDVGLVQRDGLEHDEQATLPRLERFLSRLPALADAEAARVRAARPGLVLGDIPALAFEVAARLGVPGVALGNFSWDDVYTPFVPTFPGYAAVVVQLRASYARTDLLLRLPFPLAMSAFPRRVEIPLVARQPGRSRTEARRAAGIPADATAVLLAFGGFDFASLDLFALQRLSDFLFVQPVAAPRGWRGPNVLEVASHGALPFPDLLVACDAVVTKPGYGMVADLFACRVPALFAERPRFAEYPILAAALQQHGRALPISRAALERGELQGPLERLLALDTPWSDLPLDGGERAAATLAALLD